MLQSGMGCPASEETDSGHSNLLPNAVCWPLKATEVSVVDKYLQLNSRSSHCLSSFLTIENQ